MATITQLAQNTIWDNQQYFTVEECLDHLAKGSNFISIDFQIKREIQRYCAKNSITQIANAEIKSLSETDENYIIDLLTEKILSLGDPSDNRHDTRQLVRNWIIGKRKNISRENAIKICFALELDVNQSKDFLRRCNMPDGFNVRSAEEAIWLYCILNKKPFSKIAELKTIYENAPVTVEKPDSQQPHSNTTQIMSETLSDTIWDTDEQFMDTFLLPNKAKFIGYSKTLAETYHLLKDNLLYKLLSEEIVPSFYTRQRRLGTEELLPHFKNYIKEVKTKNNLSPTDMQTLDSASSLKTITQFNTVWDILKQTWDFNPNNEKLLYKKIGFNRFLKVLFRDYAGLLGDKVLKSDQYGPNSGISMLFSDFPKRQYIQQYEKLPVTHSGTPKIRKIIILLFFLDYTYSWDPNDDNCPMPDIFEFHEKLTDLLDASMLASIYPADPFDWFILRSIRKFEDCDIDNPEDDPLSLFFDTINSVLYS